MCKLTHFQIRVVGIIWYSLCNNFVGFISEKYFPILLEIIQLQGFLLVLASNCGIGLIFVAFMNDTKGKSIDSMDTTDDDQTKC